MSMVGATSACTALLKSDGMVALHPHTLVLQQAYDV